MNSLQLVGVLLFKMVTTTTAAAVGTSDPDGADAIVISFGWRWSRGGGVDVVHSVVGVGLFLLLLRYRCVMHAVNSL